jgi:two-component system phosphate regulon response regulator PhoB
MSAILVIDDDPVSAKLLQLTLRPGGHEVEIARDMSSGQRALRTGRHDLLILDIFLPDGSGLEILRFLREELKQTIPVIVLSGHRQEEFAARAARLGATQYVTKPFSLRELLAAVDRLTG